MASYLTVSDAQAAVEAHPLCASFMNTPGSFVVFYPDTYKIPGGASVPKGINQLAALNLLYDRIDAFWQAQRLQVSATPPASA